MTFKAKILIFGIAAVFAGFLLYPFLSSAGTLSTAIFPLGLEGLSLTLVEEEPPNDEIAEGFSAYYQSEEKEIDVFFYRMRSVSIAKSVEQNLISVIKADYASLFDKVDWESSQTFSVGDYEATAIRFRVYLGGDYLDGGFTFVAVKDYFILIQIFGYEKPSFSELQKVLEIFVNKIPGNGGEQEEEEEEEEEEECGNNNCEYWTGEDCNNCRYDCDIPGFCCLPDFSYVYAHDYHNENYKIHESVAGLIPRGAILIPKGVDEDDLPLVVTQICNMGMKTGECVYNYDCPSGFCTVENWCVKTHSEKFQEIKNQDMIEKIYEDQNNYKEEFVEAYEMIEGGISQAVIKDAKLDIRLEVQGSTAGKVPKVSQGDEVEVRLEIENDSRYSLALVAGIFYPGYDTGMFVLEEKKYTISFKWDGGLSSLIGSFKTKLIGGEFTVMPPGSKIYVYSKVIPEQTGYLDIQGLIYYTTEKKYQKYDPGFLDEAPKAYQESEVSESIRVEEKPCNWWPICL